MHYPLHTHLIFKLLNVSNKQAYCFFLLFFPLFYLQNIAREKEEEREVKMGLKTNHL